MFGVMASVAAGNPANYRVLLPPLEGMLARTRHFAEALSGAYQDWLPPNIRAVGELWVSKLVDCASDGIPVWHLPRTEVIEALLDAGSTERRYAVLTQYRDEILVDCRLQIGLLEPTEQPVLKEIAAALEAGYWRAAQALAMNVVDCMVHDRFQSETKLIRGNSTAGEVVEADPEQVFVCIALHKAFRQYRRDDLDPIPASANRHASAHQAMSGQYTPTNALISLMLATSAARWKPTANAEI